MFAMEGQKARENVTIGLAEGLRRHRPESEWPCPAWIEGIVEFGHIEREPQANRPLIKRLELARGWGCLETVQQDLLTGQKTTCRRNTRGLDANFPGWRDTR
jgi:hypothetical protein